MSDSSSGLNEEESWDDQPHPDNFPDKRLDELRVILENSGISDWDVHELDSWLCSRFVDQTQHGVLFEKFNDESPAKQRETCSKLRSAAELLCARLAPVGLPPSLEQLIFDEWVALNPNRSAEVNLKDRSDQWERSKEHLTSNLAILVKLLEVVETRIQATLGRPSAEWRNDLFVKIFDRLKAILAPASQAEISRTTREVWNNYFPRHKIMDDDAALKLLQRRLKKMART